MNRRAYPAWTIAIVATVALAGCSGTGQESPTPDTPSVEASTAAGLPVGGSHVLWDAPGEVAITVTIPAAGWVGDVGGGILLKNDNARPPDGTGMIVFQGDLYVYGDPCQWSGTEPDSPATTADELVTALEAQALRDASQPMDITLDGYSGKAITLHVPDDAAFNGDSFTDCDQGYFGSWTVPVGGVAGTDGPYRYHQGPGQIDEIWAVDVDGVPVVIDWTHYAGTPAEDVDETRAIVESATFE
jgi:hypothetical protein